MRYQVSVMRKERRGPFWKRRTEYIKVGDNVCSTDDRVAALSYANDYTIWSVEAVIVSDLDSPFARVGDTQCIYIKRGSKY